MKYLKFIIFLIFTIFLMNGCFRLGPYATEAKYADISHHPMLHNVTDYTVGASYKTQVILFLRKKSHQVRNPLHVFPPDDAGAPRTVESYHENFEDSDFWLGYIEKGVIIRCDKIVLTYDGPVGNYVLVKFTVLSGEWAGEELEVRYASNSKSVSNFPLSEEFTYRISGSFLDSEVLE